MLKGKKNKKIKKDKGYKPNKTLAVIFKIIATSKIKD